MVVIRIEEASLTLLRKHLLPDKSHREQGAFLFCRHSVFADGEYIFDCQNWVALNPEDYEFQENDYLELKDKTRARLIKQAHDGQFSLVESHSHPGPFPAAFSWSDMNGLKEFVPHVKWRLPGRPYGALVFAQSGFDGLAWTSASSAPQQVNAIDTGNRRISSTGLTLNSKVGNGQI